MLAMAATQAGGEPREAVKDTSYLDTQSQEDMKEGSQEAAEAAIDAERAKSPAAVQRRRRRRESAISVDRGGAWQRPAESMSGRWKGTHRM